MISKTKDKRFAIRIGKKINVVGTDEVAYFYTEAKITFLVTHSGRRYPIDYSLSQVENFGDPNKFFRINRQLIINMEAIKEMHRHPKARIKIILSPNASLEAIVSTERTPWFKKWLVGETA